MRNTRCPASYWPFEPLPASSCRRKIFCNPLTVSAFAGSFRSLRISVSILIQFESTSRNLPRTNYAPLWSLANKRATHKGMERRRIANGACARRRALLHLLFRWLSPNRGWRTPRRPRYRRSGRRTGNTVARLWRLNNRSLAISRNLVPTCVVAWTNGAASVDDWSGHRLGLRQELRDSRDIPNRRRRGRSCCWYAVTDWCWYWRRATGSWVAFDWMEWLVDDQLHLPPFMQSLIYNRNSGTLRALRQPRNL